MVALSRSRVLDSSRATEAVRGRCSAGRRRLSAPRFCRAVWALGARAVDHPSERRLGRANRTGARRSLAPVEGLPIGEAPYLGHAVPYSAASSHHRPAGRRRGARARSRRVRGDRRSVLAEWGAGADEARDEFGAVGDRGEGGGDGGLALAPGDESSRRSKGRRPCGTGRTHRPSRPRQYTTERGRPSCSPRSRRSPLRTHLRQERGDREALGLGAGRDHARRLLGELGRRDRRPCARSASSAAPRPPRRARVDRGEQVGRRRVHRRATVDGDGALLGEQQARTGAGVHGDNTTPPDLADRLGGEAVLALDDLLVHVGDVEVRHVAHPRRTAPWPVRGRRCGCGSSGCAGRRPTQRVAVRLKRSRHAAGSRPSPVTAKWCSTGTSRRVLRAVVRAGAA